MKGSVAVCLLMGFLVAAAVASRRTRTQRRVPGVRREAYYIQSKGIVNWGEWGHWAMCPGDSFVTGFTLKTQSPVGSGIHDDNTAVNGIKVYCTQNGQDIIARTSVVQKWGEWWGGGNCSRGELAIGMKLQQVPSLHCGDDMATTDIDLYCTGSVSKIIGNGIKFPKAEPIPKMMSPKGWAICGIATQIEADQGDYRDPNCFTTGDDTALNNIRMAFCRYALPN